MRHARLATLGTRPGVRDELVALLSRRNHVLADAGCLRYDVGINENEPDLVYVSELWESEAAHRASLELDSVREGIAEAMPLLSGQMSSQHFEVVGSPIRS